ncbi:hypothetical protein PROFUN_05925 [Planoprotostelium fungivorum]|uniref:NADP-dependent oxidoreductase domain-containing protein n=1 Tax=Planoprotostelium fungivorum TaxID=1890364 RepID=A0A2P6N7L8_9EUKA|nr:hypothetical protein PROFUN_05925 [Planoprotostelium fungivorum]
MPQSAINIVFGAMTFGSSAEQSRTTSLDDCAAILDIFQKHGHKEIDTARVYGLGTSEEYLGKLKWQERGLIMDTKLYPSKAGWLTETTITHGPEDLRKHLELSLKALNAKKIDMWYLHGPDRSVPYEVTMREVDRLHREGLFDKFGISNYMSWEVAQICEICDRHGWIKPSAYQGIYNAIHRTVEPELFPCLRHYKMSFYAFNPLGGGFFAGNFKKEEKVEEGSRFDPERKQGQMYRTRYWNDAYFEALDMIRPVAEKHNLTLAEVALRWMSHHSLLKREHNDAILIGASSTKHIEQNLIDLEKEALPEEVVQVLDKAWTHVKAHASKYYH